MQKINNMQFKCIIQDIIGATKAGYIETVTHILEHSKDLDALVNLADSDEVKYKFRIIKS